MADQVRSSGISALRMPPPVSHEEFYTASDGSRWMMQAEVYWLPHYQSRVRLFKMPQQIAISLPSNLPFLDVVPSNLRTAALDGYYDLEAITRYCLKQCMAVLRDYVERFGIAL